MFQAQVPLVFCASHNEAEQAQADTTICLVDSLDQEKTGTTMVAPLPRKDETTARVYLAILESLQSLVSSMRAGSSLLLSCEDGIYRSPALAMGLRSYLYEGDCDLAVATQVAQRPQAQPSSVIAQIADGYFGFDGALVKSVKDYLATGLAVSSTGESFWHDPAGIGEDPEAAKFKEDWLAESDN